jgi:hypothetical protein
MDPDSSKTLHIYLILHWSFPTYVPFIAINTGVRSQQQTTHHVYKKRLNNPRPAASRLACSTRTRVPAMPEAAAKAWIQFYKSISAEIYDKIKESREIFLLYGISNSIILRTILGGKKNQITYRPK